MIKKYSKYLPFTTIFLVGLLFLFPLFKGFYQSHDSVTHVARTAAYVKAFLGGEFPPRWAADLNYGYGSPFLIFYYPLPGYVMAGLHLVGIPLEMTYRIFAGLVFILGPFFFYLWTRKKFSVHTALVATILYTCLPYRYLTLYVRGGIGEFLAFSLLPIIFYFLDSSLSNLKKLFITGLCIALLILSHNAVSLLFLPVIFLYATLQGKEKMMIAAASLLLGLLLSAFFWVPAIAEAKYTSPLFYFASWYKDHFVSLPGLIYSTWGFGSDINKSGGLSAQLGIVGFVILVISLLYVFKQKTDKRFLFLWIGISLVGLFLSTHLSYFF